jgi:hypothetical protein
VPIIRSNSTCRSLTSWISKGKIFSTRLRLHRVEQALFVASPQYKNCSSFNLGEPTLASCSRVALHGAKCTSSCLLPSRQSSLARAGRSLAVEQMIVPCLSADVSARQMRNYCVRFARRRRPGCALCWMKTSRCMVVLWNTKLLAFAGVYCRHFSTKSTAHISRSSVNGEN